MELEFKLVEKIKQAIRFRLQGERQKGADEAPSLAIGQRDNKHRKVVNEKQKPPPYRK